MQLCLREPVLGLHLNIDKNYTYVRTANVKFPWKVIQERYIMLWIITEYIPPPVQSLENNLIV